MKDIWKGETGAVFDLSSLSPDAADRVVQHADQEGERMYKLVISLTRAATVGVHAISVRSHVADITGKAMQLNPQASDDLKEIEAITQEEIRAIIRNGGRR